MHRSEALPGGGREDSQAGGSGRQWVGGWGGVGGWDCLRSASHAWQLLEGRGVPSVLQPCPLAAQKYLSRIGAPACARSSLGYCETYTDLSHEYRQSWPPY